MCRAEGLRPATPAEAKARGIPPAYTNVMISDDPNADLQATARTAAGKTFYLYSKAFTARSAEAKWRRVRKLNAERMQRIESRILRDASGSGEDRHVAMTAYLIMLTGLRNGGAPQGTKESFGASSLLMQHVQASPESVRLRFPGKHGILQDHEVKDDLFAAYVRSREAEGATKLFPHEAAQTLRYMKKIGLRKVHDVRTWRANELARALVQELLKIERPTSKKGVKLYQKIVATKVSEVLGNKPGQAMKSYIDPKVWEPFEE